MRRLSQLCAVALADAARQGAELCPLAVSRCGDLPVRPPFSLPFRRGAPDA